MTRVRLRDITDYALRHWPKMSFIGKNNTTIDYASTLVRELSPFRWWHQTKL